MRAETWGCVAPTIDLDKTLRGVAFAAMGTAGQRSTILRRLFVHGSVYDLPAALEAHPCIRRGRNPLHRARWLGR
ncbi:aldehyde dehydrogenase family protein [Bradyrhizobium erythrophlei]|uniref:aldehyde dehydrogenase family protein n=1 Tax=Bradyrhizobium erythrophlei TaxID=1437360 RepID=UPI0035EE0114